MEDSEDLTMSHDFGATSTTDEVLQGIKWTGKRVLVTGVSAGLGVETARALAAHGATEPAQAGSTLRKRHQYADINYTT